MLRPSDKNPAQILALVNQALARIGLRLSRAPIPADRRRLRLMQIRGVSTVIDIGANAGQYATHLRKLGYRGWIHSYEPLPDAFAQLAAQARSDPKWVTAQLAVGDSTNPVRLNIAANSVSSSILPIAQRHLDAEPAAKTVSSIEVRSTRLSDIVRALPVQPTMVKIDTQGYEKHVLTGGQDVLDKLQLIELELSLFEVYSGQPLFREMDAWLVDAGFDLVSVEEGFYNRQSGELLQMDAVYARRSGPVRRLPTVAS